MTARNRIGRRIGLGVYALASLGYLVWRALCTLNPAAPVYSWVFLGLETYAILCGIAFYAITLERYDPTPHPARSAYRVDVFICTYNEPVRLLRRTARRALALDSPHRTWILDDGRRAEVRALAAELGCGYLTRPENTHYKAGNLNNALAHTEGDLVAVLDADHLVRRDFLKRLVGYFDDERVAVVQTPQIFYNIDSFQHHFHPRRGRLWHEGAIFHHAMQPGANRWNAAFFVGTGAILRRSALAAIGGFATGSVTEDSFTCMRLHAAGYRSIYHDEPLGYLLAPESLQQYLTQRLRWGQGSMQILRRENPLTKPGLSWRQRLVYFTALSSFAQAWVHLAYYLAPALFLLGGPAPLRATRAQDFGPLFAHIGLDLVVFRGFLGPLARPLLAECYKFLNVFVFLRSIGAYFAGSGRLRFQVTPKGKDRRVSLRLLAPQCALLLLNVTAFGCGILRLTNPTTDAVATLGYAVATGFSALFALVGGMTLVFARDRLGARVEYTFPDHVQTRLLPDGGVPMHGILVRGNESELHLLLPGRPTLAAGTHVGIDLFLARDESPLHVSGHVMSLQPAALGQLAHLGLAPLAAGVEDRLLDHFVEESVPRVVDGLVEPWSRRPAPGEATDSNAYYLPLRPDLV